MIQQFTYTASPWGRSGAGWQIFQQSRNVAADAAKKLYEVYQYRYKEPKRPTVGEMRPIQFVYLPDNSGDGAVLAQTAFTGMRWWGEPRPGDFFAHVLLLDKDAVLQSCRAGFNPVRLFSSPSIQSSFPIDGGLKEKALHIFRKEIAWEPPPELSEFQSLSDLPENQRLSFESALDVISERAARQLGALVYAIVRRTTGKAEKPIVFDSGNKFSPFLMSLALDLIPPTWRARTWFAIHFAEFALRRLPEFSSLTFYGTDGAESSDPDSGIASGVDFAQDPFNFINRNDVRSFKKQLDLIGADVPIDDYNGLVNCRRISSGESADLASLRSAATFADRFTGLKDEINNGLANALATYSNVAGTDISEDFHVQSVVAWFELGFTAFESNAKHTCSICTKDLTLLEKMVDKLKDDAICTVLLNGVVAAAQNSGPAEFVNRVVDSKISLEKIVSTRAENDLLRLAVEYRKVLCDIHGCGAIESCPIDVATALKNVNALFSMVGSGVKDIVEAKKYLEYRQDIASIGKIDAILPTLEKYVATGFPRGANARKDILDRIPATSVREIVELACVLDTLNLHGRDLIYESWDREQTEVNRLKAKVRSLEDLGSRESKRSGCLFHVILIVIGVVIGFFAGRMFGGINTERISHYDNRPQRIVMESNVVYETNDGKTPNKSKAPNESQCMPNVGVDKDKTTQPTTNKYSRVEVKGNAAKVD